MSSRNAADDLFGGLSDSDSSEDGERCDGEKVPMSLLQDLEMSSEDEDTSLDESRPTTPTATISRESMSQEEKYKQPKIEFNLSEDGYSSSVPTVSTSSSSSSYDVAPSTSVDIFSRKREIIEDGSGVLEVKPKRSTSSLSEYKDAMPALLKHEENITDIKPTAAEQFRAEQPVEMVLSEKDRTPALRMALQTSCAATIPIVQKPCKLWNQKETRPRIGSSFKDEVSEQNSLSNNMREEKMITDKILIANFSSEQFDRYIAFRRSKFTRQIVKNVVAEVTGKSVTDPLAVAVAGLAKMFVGDLIEEALELRDALNEQNRPVQPHHIRSAFTKLSLEGKIWPPFGQKF